MHDYDDASQQQAMLQEEEQMTNHFAELAAIDVSKYIEKKGNLSYLSWAWAVDQLLRRDPSARWEYAEPIRYGDTMMVVCTVTAFGKSMTMQLPVMDHRNKAIANPDAFAVNTAMQRCLVKAIALHGLGLYVYAGEDLPRTEDGDKPEHTPAEHIALQVATDRGSDHRKSQSGDVDQDQTLTFRRALIGIRRPEPSRHVDMSDRSTS